MPQAYKAVKYVDNSGNQRDALILFPSADGSERVDLIYVDESKKEVASSAEYFLALVRKSGVPHKSMAQDEYFEYFDEPKAEAPPQEEPTPESTVDLYSLPASKQ